jgi:hypothetical protein
MQYKVSLMTVFRYIYENVLQFTKRWFVSPPNLASMLVPRVLEAVRPGAGGQEARQGAVPPGGGDEVSFGWCRALPGQWGGMAWRDLLSARSLQEPMVDIVGWILGGIYIPLIGYLKALLEWGNIPFRNPICKILGGVTMCRPIILFT